MKTKHGPLDINAFDAACKQTTSSDDYPLSSRIVKNIVCYEGDDLRAALVDSARQEQYQQELIQLLSDGPGVFIVQGFFDDITIIQRVNTVIEQLFELQKNQKSADHFAQAGANGRIWNSLQKTAIQDPDAHIEYYKNPLFKLVSEAWLGPHFQMTAQVNVVRPSGKAQAPHRDYHLGFQDNAVLLRYPPHVHKMSAMLTLQGAVAHTDMPLESGPTLLLPFSQQYDAGYLAWRDTAFKTYFDEHAVQLQLSKGDAMFFNPALFHAAGNNSTKDFHRMANLVQLSSAFGRSMESVDRVAMCLALYASVQRQKTELSEIELETLLSNTCEGYSFPTNLDTDPPDSGMAPQTQKQLMMQALTEQWNIDVFKEALLSQSAKRQVD